MAPAFNHRSFNPIVIADGNVNPTSFSVAKIEPGDCGSPDDDCFHATIKRPERAASGRHDLRGFPDRLVCAIDDDRPIEGGGYRRFCRPRCILITHFNGQNGGPSGMLDWTKRILLKTYTQTPDISRNGQAVTIRFSDFVVDIVPGFYRQGGGF
jgi:hypothetical protein